MNLKGLINILLTGIFIGIVLAGIDVLINFVNGKTFVFNDAFIKDAGIYILYAVVLTLLNGYYFNYLNHRVKWGNTHAVVRVAVGAFGSIVLTMFGVFMIRMFIKMILEGSNWDSFMASENPGNYIYSFFITAFASVVFHAIHFYKELQKNKIKEQKIIAGTASAQFDALKNQLDPHFLFNSLNVLTSLIEENPDSAQKFTTSLSKVYRYVLEQKNKELVTVDEELKFARTFVNLLKMRFEDSIVFEIPEQAGNPEAKVVPLSLQLLLENAVKHNMVTAKNPLQIKIFEKNGNLIVWNNLQPKAVVNSSSGVGLRNIQQRYAILTNRQVVITKTENSFEVAVPMLTKKVETMRTETIDNNTYSRAKKKVEELKELYQSLISYCIVIPFLIYINYTSSWDFQWFWFPALGWGMGIAFQVFKVYGPGINWEERKIRQYMEEEKKTSKWN